MSCVYGNPNQKLRHLVWKMLNRIGIQTKEMWGLIGDFNEILHNGEKLGGPRRGLPSYLSLICFRFVEWRNFLVQGMTLLGPVDAIICGSKVYWISVLVTRND